MVPVSIVVRTLPLRVAGRRTAHRLFRGGRSGRQRVSNLEVLMYSKVTQIDFSDGEAVAVHYNQRSGLDQSQTGTAGTVRLNSSGLLIMAAGALVTPRLLLLSGVGPRGRESEIFAGQSVPPSRSTTRWWASGSTTMS